MLTRNPKTHTYNDIWSALARRFGMLDGPRESMKRFDARRQNENETLVEYEQALRMLHREGWPTATIEQRDLSLIHISEPTRPY